MAAAGFTPISLYHTTTALAEPTAGNLVAGELALNTTDEKLYFKNTAGVVTLLATAGGGGGSGTVTSVSVVSANGLAGTVANATSTPAITLSTSITGVLKGDGTAISAAVAGTDYVTPTGTGTLTNKRVTPRVLTTTSSATPTINTDNVDQYGLTALTVNITSFTTNLTGTPTNGQKLWIYIVGTATRTIAWGAKFESSTVALPTTTVSTARLDVGFVWNAVSATWRCVAVA